LCSQEPDISPYPEPDVSNPHPPILSSWNPFLGVLHTTAWALVPLMLKNATDRQTDVYRHGLAHKMFFTHARALIAPKNQCKSRVKLECPYWWLIWLYGWANPICAWNKQCINCKVVDSCNSCHQRERGFIDNPVYTPWQLNTPCWSQYYLCSSFSLPVSVWWSKVSLAWTSPGVLGF
jgi:hypothetical protein